MFRVTKLVPQCFYVAYRTLLVMLCVLKFYYVDFNGMFTLFKFAKFRRRKMHTSTTMRFEMPPKNVGFVAFLRTESHYIKGTVTDEKNL